MSDLIRSIILILILWTLIGLILFDMYIKNSDKYKNANKKQKIFLELICGPIALIKALYNYIYNLLGD